MFSLSSKTMLARAATRQAAPASRRVATRAAAADNKLATLQASGLVGAIAPFEDGLDPLQFSLNADDSTLKRYREAELTHGRVCMLGSLGFVVGEAVEGSSFLFDAQVTGPAVKHFDQVPLPFWFLLAATIGVSEATRIQAGWQDPGNAEKLFLLKEDYAPGDLNFDPLGLTPTDPADFLIAQQQELSHARLAMIGLSGMIAQELVTGLQLFASDEVFEMEGIAGLKAMEEACAGKPDEAACAVAFEKAAEVAVRAKELAFLQSEGIPL